MKKIIFLTGSIFLTLLICASSVATASISNNNIGSIATGSNSNSTSILSDNSGTIGAESNANTGSNVNNTTGTNTDTTRVLGSDTSNKESEAIESNSVLPDNAAQ